MFKNKINGKSYIGCSNDIEKRKYNHIRESNSPSLRGYNFSFHKAIRKYGIENFDFIILEQTDNLFEREKFWIKYYDTFNTGYNETLGGDCGPVKYGEENGNAKLSKEDVYNIRLSCLNKEMPSKVYEEYKNKISRRGFNHVWLGHTWKDILPEAIQYTKTKEYITSVRKFAGKGGL